MKSHMKKDVMTFVDGTNLYQREIVYDVEKQEQIIETKLEDVVQTKVHYLYPLNKSNIDMIQKIIIPYSIT